MVKTLTGKKRPTARAKSAVAVPNSAEAIGHRAYQRFEARGCEHGHDVEDWLVAEADLRDGKTSDHRQTTSRSMVARRSPLRVTTADTT